MRTCVPTTSTEERLRRRGSSERSANYTPVYVGQPRLRSDQARSACCIDRFCVKGDGETQPRLRSTFCRRTLTHSRGSRAHRQRRGSQHPSYVVRPDRLRKRRTRACTRSPVYNGLVLLYSGPMVCSVAQLIVASAQGSVFPQPCGVCMIVEQPTPEDPSQVCNSFQRSRTSAKLVEIRQDNYRQLKASGYFDRNRNGAGGRPSFGRGSQTRSYSTKKALSHHQGAEPTKN